MLNIQNSLNIIQQLNIGFRFNKSSHRYFNNLISQYIHLWFQSKKKNSTTIVVQFNETHFLLFTMKSIKGFLTKKKAHTWWFTFESYFLSKHVLKTRDITYLIIQYNDYASKYDSDSTKHIFSLSKKKKTKIS